MPMSMEEYEIGLSYTIMKMEQQNTNSKEGVEVLQQVPFEDEKLGNGQYTSKDYHLQSKIPSWMKGFAPASALTVHEESWCAYPNSRTEIIDIASQSRDYWSKAISAPNVDLTAFRSQRTSRGPLLKGWMDSCRPVMTTYKLVIMDAPIWGLGERLEDCIIAGERALFLACHRLCFAWIDEWYGMTLDQIQEMERQTDLLLKKTLKKPAKAGSKHDGKRKTLKEEIVAVGSCT
uniref:Phosphatidylinositol transfer protein N-terminal domain-containing protein n=1 Tax=Oryza punctata TaxID=4537 RepID=A0A0E0KCA7_ORYPU